MGCFSITCVGSGMSITSGQRAVFIPLLSNSYRSDRDKGAITLTPMSMIVANEGANALYKAFSLPIYGEYNDYGSLENIERNSTVEEIERFFGVDIDTFMDIITRNWCEDLTKEHKKLKNKGVLKVLSGCFFNRDIYDFFGAPHPGPEISNDFLTDADVSSTTLRALGFTRCEKEDLIDPERYKKVWRMKGDTKNIIYSDSTWTHINQTSGLYHPNTFIECWNGVSDVKIDPTEYVGFNKYHFEYDNIVASFAKPKVDDDGSLSKILAEMKESNMDHKLPFGGSWKTSFKDLYQKRMTSDPDLKKEFMQFFCLQGNMFINNKIFMPMYSGPQCGEPEAQLLLAEKMVEVLKEQVKEREE